MTRSVEIPEEGELQDLAWSDARTGIVNELRARASEHERISAMGAQDSPAMRRRLAEMRAPSYAQQATAERQLADQVAALPYLVPAAPSAQVEITDEILDRATEAFDAAWTADNGSGDQMRVALETIEPLLVAAAPAGDGGLREALGQAWDDGNATGLDGYVGPGRGAGEVDPEAVAARERIVDKLAAHPAAPAVPQPADQGSQWTGLAPAGGDGGQPLEGTPMRISDEARAVARDAALLRWGSGSADTTQMLLSVDAALAALPAAVPQPVDREALTDLLSDFVDSDDCWYDHHGYCQAHGWFRTDPACPHARAKAVLAGEQEQARG